MEPVLVYPSGPALYLNLTQRCPTRCVFCPKHSSGPSFQGFDLSLPREPEAAPVWSAVLEAIRRRTFTEFVFCGFGDCVYRLDLIREVGGRLAERFPLVRRRLNTTGLGSAVWGRDIVPELALSLDRVSVSLNTADPEQWERLHRPLPEFRGSGFESAKAFVRRCVDEGLETTVTAIALPGVDLEAVAALALSLGASFRERAPLIPADS